MKYRHNVCAVIRDGNSVLLCHRIDSAPHKGWQFPQGGIDPKKDLIKEMKRELLEEIGTDAVEIVKILPKAYKYVLPESLRKDSLKGFDGQQQKWILCEFADKNQIIKFDKYHKPEFDDFRWVKAEEALERIIDFKKKVYFSALSDLGLL